MTGKEDAMKKVYPVRMGEKKGGRSRKGKEGIGQNIINYYLTPGGNSQQKVQL